MESLIALDYNNAKKLLQKDNYQIQTRYTRPPRQLVGLGHLRVIGQRVISENCIELIVSHEDFHDSK